MSTDERLARLGVLHLKHDEKALAAAMAKQQAAYDAKMKTWREKREKARKAGTAVPLAPTTKERVPQVVSVPPLSTLKAQATVAAAATPAPEPVPDAITTQAKAVLDTPDVFLKAYTEVPAARPALDALLAQLSTQTATLDQAMERLSALQAKKPGPPAKK